MNFEQQKTNLFDWFYFGSLSTGMEKDANVLFLGDKDDQQEIIAMLEGRVKNVSLRLDDQTYDYVVIPVLTKKVLRLFQGKTEEMFRALQETWLFPGGSILVGIENALEFDRMSTGIMNSDVSYMRWSEISAMREKTAELFEKKKEQLYFLTPALEMPLQFFTEERMPFAEELDDSGLRSLCQENAFRQMAPAYLYILCPEEDKQTMKSRHGYTPVYIKYNSSRKPEYAIKTVILQNEKGERQILKEGIGPEANAHIDRLKSNAERLEKANPRVRVLRAGEHSRALGSYQLLSYQLYPYLTGPNLAQILSEHISNGAAPIKEIRESMDMLISAGEDGMVSPANLDCLFENVIMQSGYPTLIDCEWVQEEAVPVRFLQYRMLYYWYLSNADRLNYGGVSGFLREFDFSRDEIAEMEKREQQFQISVHGEGEKNNIAAYRENKVTVKHFQELQEELKVYKLRNKELETRLHRQDIVLKKSLESERLTQTHAANLENVVRIHERDIATLIEEREFYKSHQGMKAKLQARINDTYSRWFPEGTRKRKIMYYVRSAVFHPVKMLPRFMTAEGRNRIRGDFAIGRDYLTFGKLVFPKTDAPKVSIVIPCYNQVDYTYRCLRSILNVTDFEKNPYEVIIADDVSTDATRELGMYTENLIIARNRENMGFLKNCNQAAAAARGDYIFFLNNDTTVSENWLSSLVELMEKDRSIGMAGSKLIYPDGRLQEAGGIIWADGSGWNYGRLQNPDEPEYNYVKEVDYISGAAIMIRRSLWLELGGFDEHFAPAYYEDVDLAFQVRNAGMRVVYQPLSVVTHYEGISNGTDVNGSGLKRYQVINQEKFCEKWKDALEKQEENTGNPNPFRARERGKGKKYLLFVEHYVPTWDKDAGSKLDYQYIRLFLKKGIQVKVLGDNFKKEEPYTSILQQMGVEVLYGNKMQAEIWNWLERNRNMIDIAYLNRPHIAAKYIDFLREYTNMKILFFGCDLHSLRLGREYEISGDEKILEEAEYWHDVEFSVMQKADMSYYPSVAEKRVIHQENPVLHVKAITAFIYDDKLDIPDNYAEREGLLFVGGFGHPPNKDAVLWFVEEILPAIHAVLPEIPFRIVGSHVPEEIQALHGKDHIEVLGFVSDERLAELYLESRVVVAPLRFGAGIKGKIVDALHNGAAIVTTSIGAEGITDGEQVLCIKDNAKDFADAVIRLYPDHEAIREMSVKAQACIEKHYTEDGAWEIIKDDFR